MAVDGDFANFRATYDDLTDEVDRASYRFLGDHLRSWFRTLDSTQRITQLVQALQDRASLETWLSQHGGLQGMAQSGFRWPKGPQESLGIQLLLFRAFAEGQHALDIGQFGFGVLHRGKGPDDSSHAVIEQMFMPMARALRRYLEQEIEKVGSIAETPQVPEIQVPASDRVVTLDDNMRRQLSEAVATLEHILQGTNDFEDVQEKEQRIAELGAFGRLVQAARVRVEPIISLLRPLAIDAVTKLKGMFVENAVKTFLAFVAGVLKVVWPWIIPPAN